MQIVHAAAGQLFDGDRPFRSVLVNAFYLQDEVGYGRIGALREVLDKCVRMGVRVVRTWAFNDGARANAMRTAPGVFREEGLRALDVVLAEARARGIRLLLPLADYWPSYGGVPEVLRWLGLDAPARF